jgi:hypothetical protein
MKKMKKNVMTASVFLLMFLGYGSAFANQGVALSVLPYSGSKAVVTVLNPNAKLAIVEIESLKGDEVFYYENLGKAEINKKVFDLSKMQEGSYRIKVRAGNEESASVVVKNESGVSIKEQGAYSKPTFERFGNHTVLLSSEETVKDDVVVALYSDHNLLFQKKYDNLDRLNLKYRFENIVPGDYFIKLMIGEKSFYYNLPIQ